jgi:hypothetical protein
VNEDPAPTPEEQERTPELQDELQGGSGPGHENDELPGEDPPAEPITES